jgi:hypothetical protein
MDISLNRQALSASVISLLDLPFHAAHAQQQITFVNCLIVLAHQ